MKYINMSKPNFNILIYLTSITTIISLCKFRKIREFLISLLLGEDFSEEVYTSIKQKNLDLEFEIEQIKKENIELKRKNISNNLIPFCGNVTNNFLNYAIFCGILLSLALIIYIYPEYISEISSLLVKNNSNLSINSVDTVYKLVKELYKQINMAFLSADTKMTGIEVKLDTLTQIVNKIIRDIERK